MDAFKYKIGYLFIGILVGLFAYALVFDKSAENQRLTSDRDQARAQLAELSALRPQARAYIRRANGPTTPPRDSTVRETPSRAGAGLPFEITEEDKRLMQALEDRRRNGEYINELEDPLQRKLMRHSISEGVQMLAAQNRTNLAPLFARMGLSDAANEQLQAHVSKINEAAMEVRGSVDQLLTARSDYDKRVQSLLSPGDYEQYRQYEASGPARQEYENIQRFAEQDGIPTGEDDANRLVEVIQQAQAYPRQSYLGPYDGLPSAAVGKENVLQHAEQRLAEVQDGANRALQLAAEQGLSEASIDLLFKYYNQNVQNRVTEIAMIRDPLTEQRQQAEMERRAQEDMQKLQQDLAKKQAQKP